MTSTDAGRLAKAELEVLDQLGNAYRSFVELDVYHPADHDEFVHHVHALARIVMARAAARAHPERPWIKPDA